MPDVDFRSLPIDEAIAWLGEHGEPADPRPDLDTASLVSRFPHIAGVVVDEVVIEGARGRVPARVYADAGAPPSGRALVWVHGGAFIGGHLDMPESHWLALELAARGIPVLTLDYTKCLRGVHFPVPSDDVLAGWRFAREHASDLFGVDEDDVLLGGASAGGNLTAGAVARLRDANEPTPSGLVLVYPVVHPNGPDASAVVDLDSPQGVLALNFAGSTGGLADPHAFAALGPVGGFPATLVVVCEHDPLRPSGEAFHLQLRDAGVATQLHIEAGADHGHINEPSDPAAGPTVEAIAQWIRSQS
ncbi:alpha/beta hydrolase [Microbacterium sp. Marseille-Q6648]|uniref:alpha/beta hydrolase n=1 Tax=Microbacterium sp. Marseille-Q6648 TaxID=2937991 RepID=UPI00203BADB0|nr:alpha/beta hydrolase [Microbacterium sp. Marseille-Q6648]